MSKCDSKDIADGSETSGNSAEVRELKLAQIRIQQLELKLAMKEEIENCRLLCEDKIKQLDLEAGSVMSSKHSVKMSRANIIETIHCNVEPYREPKSYVQEYVDSLHEKVSVGEHNTVRVGPALRIRNECRQEAQTVSELGNIISVCMGLPKKEIKRFNGNPMDYWGFIRSFMSSIDRYTCDASNRLAYLIQYCDGDALESIKSCTILEPELGYDEALRILERRFGQPYLIARCYIKSLTEGPAIRHDDARALTDLAERMKLCSATLRQLNYMSDLNSCRTLGDIVRRLPMQMQSKWFEIATTILRHKGEPTFAELAKFVDDKADAANTRLLYVIPGTSNTYPQASSRSETGKHRIYAVAADISDANYGSVTSARKLQCVKCEAAHYLDQCPEFKALNDESRHDAVKKLKLCFLCLKPNHCSKDCRSRRVCGLNQCSQKHHPLLHRDGKTSEPKVIQPPQHDGRVHYGVTVSSGPKVSLGVVPVKVTGPLGTVTTYAFLDNGSDSTLVENSLLERVGIKGRSDAITLKTLNSDSRVDVSVVSFEIEDLTSTETLIVDRAWSVHTLPKLPRFVPSKEQLHRWQHLQGIPLPEIPGAAVSILIGCDLPKAHWVLDQRFGTSKDPYAVRGPLGWMLLGPTQSRSRTKEQETSVHHLSADESISLQLETMFNYEFNENHSIKRAMSIEDRNALDHMKTSLKFVDGHYQIALPWRNGRPNLPSNKEVAYHRLNTLRRRLMNDKLLCHLYTSKLEDYISNGHAELVPVTEQERQDTNIWYLPHHPVFKSTDLECVTVCHDVITTEPKKPNKLRVVFDCAAKFKGVSLNSQLLTGPDLVNNLCGVLLRFREHQYAFVADIEAMFHQVKVPADDRDSLRFLWWPKGDLSESPKTYRMTVHPFGATSSPSCASLALKQALEDNLDIHDDTIAKVVGRAFYVDDCLMSLPTVQGIQQVTLQLKTVLLKGGFNLTKFFSNEREGLVNIPSKDVSGSVINLDKQQVETQKALGVVWDGQSDDIRFKVSEWQGKPTRRSILSFVASLYDPLGLVAPILLVAKSLLQELCKRRLEWDELMDAAEITVWMDWLNDLSELTELRIPRCIKPRTFGDTFQLDLHSFSDASEAGYGAAVYARLIDVDGSVHCSLLIGKSRVAPMRTVSIPRMELTAAVLAARLTTYVRGELSTEVKTATLWTDSMIVLQLIRNTSSRYETFVANRLSIIHALTDPSDWKHVDTKQNPADLASRGMRTKDPRTKEWFNGPAFLWKEETSWPAQPSSSSTKIGYLEPKNHTLVHTTQRDATWLNCLSSFGTWTSLVRKVAWLHRFCAYVSPSYAKRHGDILTDGGLTVKVIKDSETRILRLVQQDSFHLDLSHFNCSSQQKTIRSLKANSSPLRSLSPFMHKGLLRVGGRLNWSQTPFDSKHPVILPSRHFVTDLLILHFHKLNGHVGTLQVLSELRTRYWILKGQAAVRRVLSTCFHCKRWHSQPGRQLMAPLPEDRLLPNHPPFSTVGVDYFGPLLVKRGRGTEKRYGCIFTCLTMRAVHVEVVHTLETDSFLCAFSRFVSRRGCPRRLYSDNGTNFRGSEREIRECIKQWNQEKITGVMLDNGCDWIFSPPKASHRGGVWERLIRSIRRILLSLTEGQVVNDETLVTLLTEVEKIMNDRPLTKSSDDPQDFSVLTPNHLLLLRTNPSGSVPTLTTSYLTRRWRQVQHLADTFWSRWIKEYLPNLQKRQRWTSPAREFAPGDLVLLTNEAMPRGQWNMGIVDQSTQGRDGLVRDVLLRTTNGTQRRDVRHLCLLEEANNV